MGDKTAKNSGRLSLNPLRHIDWLGAFCLVFFHIGWAKPVPINPFMFKKKKQGIIIVSLAGVFVNFMLAIISIFAMCFVYKYTLDSSSYLFSFFYSLSAVNIGLGIFNLIPIPPLDGSKVLAEFLPLKARIKFLQFERYGGIVLVLLIYFAKLSTLLGFLLQNVFNLLFSLIAGVVL